MTDVAEEQSAAPESTKEGEASQETAVAKATSEAAQETETSQGSQQEPEQSGAQEKTAIQKATEQAAEETKAEGEGEKPREGESEIKPGAPESYEKFETPDGGIELGDAMAASIGEVSKELNLPQEQAQQVFDAVAKSQQQQIVDLRRGWQEAAQQDSEFGGSKYEENLGLASKALDKFGSDELRGLLADKNVGLGDHPEVIRMLVRVGKAVSDDKLLDGQGRTTPQQLDKSTIAKVLFGESSSTS